MKINAMCLRPETAADYAAIMRLHTRAFGGQLSEALIVALLRQRPAYDPDLSLVAEVDGQVAGHALFMPGTIRLLGQTLPAVNLAPIGIDPAYQRQGIGAALMQEGHRVSREKGYVLSYLLGHVEYYPRFGYRTGVFGAASVQVDVQTLRQKKPLPVLESRLPQEEDISTLQALWRWEEDAVDFTALPGDLLLDWVSPNPLHGAVVYLHEGSIVGYTRGKLAEPHAPGIFLAVDNAAAWAIASQLGQQNAQVTLPLHPYSSSASTFEGVQSQAWEAGMACSLVVDSPFDKYYTQLQAGKRLAGRPIWGTAFDL